MTPLMPPTYMMPGIPRFRLPDFSVRISPVLPNSRGMPCITARGKKDTKLKPIRYASFLLLLRRVTL